MRVAHQQTEARNDPSVVGKAEIRGQFLIAQPPSHDAQNRLISRILRHTLDFFPPSLWSGSYATNGGLTGPYGAVAL
jgi:hypothetical protein